MTSPGFAVVDGGFVDATTMQDPSLGGAAGGIQSTGRDLLRFGDGAVRRDAAVARIAGSDAGFRAGRGPLAYGITHSYGLGLEQYVTDAVTVLGHLGTGLHRSFLGYDAATTRSSP